MFANGAFWRHRGISLLPGTPSLLLDGIVTSVSAPSGFWRLGSRLQEELEKIHCSLLIYKARESAYLIVCKLPRVVPPLLVVNALTNGTARGFNLRPAETASAGTGATVLVAS